MQTKFLKVLIAYLPLAPSVLIVIIFLIVPSSAINSSQFLQNFALCRIARFLKVWKILQHFFRSADYRNSLKVTIIFTERSHCRNISLLITGYCRQSEN